MEHSESINAFIKINEYYEEHQEAPYDSDDQDTNALYWELDHIKSNPIIAKELSHLDKHGLLIDEHVIEEYQDIYFENDSDAIDQLMNEEFLKKKVKSKKINRSTQPPTINKSKEVSAYQNKPCEYFSKFEAIFISTQEQLKTQEYNTIEVTRNGKHKALLEKGEMYILNGQMIFINNVIEQYEYDADADVTYLHIINEDKTQMCQELKAFKTILGYIPSFEQVLDNDNDPLKLSLLTR